MDAWRGYPKDPVHMKSPTENDQVALARHGAVCWVEQAIKENFTLTRALTLASEREWGGRFYKPSTLEDWFYVFRHEGFEGLQRPVRKDKGTRKALSPEACEALLGLRREHPQLKAQVLVRRLVEQGTLQEGTFSMPTVYRLFTAHGLDSRSIKLQSQGQGPAGPTKAFECALPNELWMTDMMFGPTLKLATGKAIQTRLFGLIDDCSRLVPHAQYYEGEKLPNFLDCFRQGLARRGFPDKLYTDQGKIFTSSHLKIVCANLKIRLVHAKPYHAWSKGKIERFFRTLQEDFQARLVLEPARSLAELNLRLWRWIETEYHQRIHSALQRQCPAERFAQRSQNLRTADPQTDWLRLFLARAKRRVRLDATVSLSGQLWEVSPHLRGRLIELRYDPFNWKTVEVWHQDAFVELARRCDKQLNSKTYTDQDYERPDKSS